MEKNVGGNPNWKKGMQTPYSGGRQKGATNKKTRALNAVYEIMNNADNLKKFYRELQKQFDRDPLRFYESYVRPHEPKEFNMELDNTGERPTVRGSVELAGMTYEELIELKRAQKLLLKAGHINAQKQIEDKPDFDNMESANNAD